MNGVNPSPARRSWRPLGDLGGEEPDPALFGYSFDFLMARLAALGRPGA